MPSGGVSWNVKCNVFVVFSVFFIYFLIPVQMDLERERAKLETLKLASFQQFRNNAERYVAQLYSEILQEVVQEGLGSLFDDLRALREISSGLTREV